MLAVDPELAVHLAARPQRLATLVHLTVLRLRRQPRQKRPVVVGIRRRAPIADQVHRRPFRSSVLSL